MTKTQQITNAVEETGANGKNTELPAGDTTETMGAFKDMMNKVGNQFGGARRGGARRGGARRGGARTRAMRRKASLSKRRSYRRRRRRS